MLPTNPSILLDCYWHCLNEEITWTFSYHIYKLSNRCFSEYAILVYTSWSSLQHMTFYHCQFSEMPDFMIIYFTYWIHKPWLYEFLLILYWGLMSIYTVLQVSHNVLTMDQSKVNDPKKYCQKCGLKSIMTCCMSYQPIDYHCNKLRSVYTYKL